MALSVNFLVVITGRERNEKDLDLKLSIAILTKQDGEINQKLRNAGEEHLEMRLEERTQDGEKEKSSKDYFLAMTKTIDDEQERG